MQLKYFLNIMLTATLFACSDSETLYQGYIEGQNVYIASPYSGVLQKLYVTRGQVVQKGQALFNLDNNPQALTLIQNENDLLKAQNTLIDLKKPSRLPEINAIIAQIAQVDAEINLAKIRVERNEKLYIKKVVDKDSMDAAIARLANQQALKAQYEANLNLARMGGREDRIKAQEAQVAALMEKVKIAKWDLDQKSRKSPQNGVIYDTYFSNGEYVPAQQAVLSLLPPENIYIVFFLPLSAMQAIHLQQTIHFGCENCTKNNAATINYISAVAEYLPPLVYSRDNDDKLVFRIHAKVSNPLSFKPGQPVMVRLK